MVDLDESAKIAHKSNTSSPEQVNDFAFEKHVVVQKASAFTLAKRLRR